MKPKRRVLKEFRIEELSAVDNPEQQGATSRIMKSASATKEFEFIPALVWDGNGTFTKVRKDDDPDLALLQREASRLQEKLADLEGLIGQETEQMSKEAFTKADVEALAGKFVGKRYNGNDSIISPATATEMARARLLRKSGLYDAGYLTETTGSQPVQRFAKAEEVTKFEGIVADIRTSEKCSHQVAMQKARKMHPRQFEAYRAAEPAPADA